MSYASYKSTIDIMYLFTLCEFSTLEVTVWEIGRGCCGH